MVCGLAPIQAERKPLDLLRPVPEYMYAIVRCTAVLQMRQAFIPDTCYMDMHLAVRGFVGFARHFFQLFPNTDRFLLAKLHLGSLKGKRSQKAVRIALDGLQRGQMRTMLHIPTQ